MPMAHGASGDTTRKMGAYLFRAVQYGASRLELSAIKPENSRKIVPFNFIFFRDESWNPSPGEKFSRKS